MIEEKKIMQDWTDRTKTLVYAVMRNDIRFLNYINKLEEDINSKNTEISARAKIAAEIIEDIIPSIYITGRADGERNIRNRFKELMEE